MFGCDKVLEKISNFKTLRLMFMYDSKVGILTVDLGLPSLSMHSIRETMGCQDLGSNARLFTTFYGQFGELDWLYTGFGPPSFSSLHL